MTYTYPLPTPPVVDTTPITTAINAINAELDTISAAVDEIPPPPDLSGFALKSEISAASKGEIIPVYDPLPAPSPIIAPTTMNGATLVTGVTGSVMVNGGAVHSFARLSTPPIVTWNGTLSISPVTGACKVRWAITSTVLGTTEVSIDGGTAPQASNTGTGWVSANTALAVFTDGDFSWFEVAVPAKGTGVTTVQVTTPTGRGQLPTIYAANAITSLAPTTPTALKLKDPATAFELVYRPSELATKAEIPTVPPAPDLSLYARKDSLLVGDVVANTTNLAALQGKPGEIRHLLSDGRLYRWAAPIPDRLQTTFPANTGRNPIPVGSSYWSKFGEWLPFYAEYLQDFGWKRAGQLNETIYGVKLTSGTVTDIEYEFSDPADINVTDYVSYSAQHIATWTDSSYWGGKTRFESVTMSSGRIVKAITCIRDDGSVLLCSLNNAGTATGYVRYVQINGKPADTYPVQMADLDSRIDQLKTGKQSILNWSTTEQLTGRTWTDGKPTYIRTFTGNTPAGGADTRILQVTGSTKIVHWEGYVTSSGSRKAFMPGMYSGDVNHGPMYQWYNATDLNSYFTFTDTRWNSRPYEITVEYCK